MRLGAALASLALLAGCAGATEPALADTSDPCDTAGAQDLSLDHAGSTRTYQLVVPPAAKRGEPLPLVIGMHGGWGTGAGFGQQSGLTELAARAGYVLALPDGRWRSWNAGSCCGRAAKQGFDDVGFIRKLAGQLGKLSCVDANHVYGTGFSNGAMLAHRVACDAPDVFDAIAPVAGPRMTESCAADTPISALLIRGEADPRIPLAGGVYDGSFRASLKAMTDSLAQRNGCTASETHSRPGADCTVSRGCNANTVVEACTVRDTGHQWPGGKTYLEDKLGPNPGVFDASAVIWSFFDNRNPETPDSGG